MGVWVEVHKYLRFCSWGFLGDQTGFQPPAPLGFVFRSRVSVQYVALQAKEIFEGWCTIVKTDHTKNFLSFLLTFFSYFFFFLLRGSARALSCPSFHLRLLSWLKAAAHDKWMCLFVPQMLACVRRAADGGRKGSEGGRGHKRQAVTSSVRCPPYVSSHVSRAVVIMHVKILCGWECFGVFFFSCLPDETSFLHHSVSLECQREGIRIIVRNRIRVCCSTSLE